MQQETLSATIPGPVLASLLTEYPETSTGLLLGTSALTTEKIMTDDRDPEEKSSRHFHIQEYCPGLDLKASEFNNRYIGMFSIRKDSFPQPSFRECIAAHSISKLTNASALVLVINLPDNTNKWVLSLRYTCYYLNPSSMVPHLVELEVPNLSNTNPEKYKESRYLNANPVDSLANSQVKSSYASTLLALSIQQCVMSQTYAHSILDDIWVGENSTLRRFMQ